MPNLIVAGWYTEDYAHWLPRLRASLDKFGHEHDFVEVHKAAGGWERNTMRKPAQILAAMDRHPNRTIVFLDVDCEVLDPLDGLAGISADVAMHFRCRYMRDGTPRLNARSGTMVFRPTAGARSLVERWALLSLNAPRGAVDQRTLPMAIATTPGASVAVLDVRHCAVPNDRVSDPVILHDSASRSIVKIPSWKRTLNAMMGNLAAIRGGKGQALIR